MFKLEVIMLIEIKIFEIFKYIVRNIYYNLKNLDEYYMNIDCVDFLWLNLLIVLMFWLKFIKVNKMNIICKIDVLICIWRKICILLVCIFIIKVE